MAGKMNLVMITFSFLLCFAGCSGILESEDGINYSQQTDVLLVGDTRLNYGIAIPDNQNAEDGIPLILALHYGGTVTSTYGYDFMNQLILPALSDLGGIIISPNCPSASGWTHPTSTSAALALIDDIKTKYNINDTQIIVTGFSMGGVGTWYFATHYDDIFSAAIPIAGMPDNNTIISLDDIPVYVIHGVNDEIFSHNQVEGAVTQLQNRGADVELYSISGLGHYATDRYVEPLKTSIEWLRDKLNM